jgi:hypothetical protein
MLNLGPLLSGPWLPAARASWNGPVQKDDYFSRAQRWN